MTRMQPDERMASIVDRCADHYVDDVPGLLSATRQDVAEVADCSPALVAYHFGDMPSLRYAVLKELERRGA